MPSNERLRVTPDLPDFGWRRRHSEDILNQVARRCIARGNCHPFVKHLNALVELAFEAIDCRAIETFKSWRTEYLIKSVLTFD